MWGLFHSFMIVLNHQNVNEEDSIIFILNSHLSLHRHKDREVNYPWIFMLKDWKETVRIIKSNEVYDLSCV